MKHFVMLAFAFIAGYVTWQLIPRKDRRYWLPRLQPHARVIAGFLVVLAFALVLMFYLPAIKLL